MANSVSSESGRISALDRELLQRLEASFLAHAGEDARIDASDLQRALGIKSEYLAKRVLVALDLDHDGSLDREEFVAAVRALVFGSDLEKLAFVFKLHDDNGDGSLSELELLRMISIGLAESDLVSRKSQPPERLARAVAREADRDGDGRVSFEEFVAVMQRHPALLAKITRSEAMWLAPNEELIARLAGARPVTRSGVGRWLDNHLGDSLLLLTYVGVCVALFVVGLAERVPDAPAPLAYRLGRAFGKLASFHTALVLVPVLRGLFTRLRRSWLGRKLDVDAAIDVHRWVGQLLFALSWAHALGYALAYTRGHASLGLAHLVLGTLPGASGALLLLTFSVMWAFSQTPIRRSRRFELFYFSHLLYALFLVVLVVHAPSFLVFGGVPALWLAIEQLSRRRRRGRRATAHVRPLRSGVTELRIERPEGFRFEAGDYVFLNVPHLARREWHPFTLSSSEGAGSLSIHVRSLGNWTSALRSDAERREQQGQDFYDVRVDGPYGSPTAHLFEARHAVMIGAGIGVTPFASVLSTLADRADAGSASKLESLHFFWLNRDAYSFEWFGDLLARLEQRPGALPLSVHAFMTGGHGGSTSAALEIARAILHQQGRRDLVTGLRELTHFGHPDWDVLLAGIAERAAPEPVSVFFCGPVGLGRKLRAVCARVGMRFHEEKF